MLSVVKEQCVNLKFLVKRGKTATEAHILFKQIYGDGYLLCNQGYEWFKKGEKR